MPILPSNASDVADMVHTILPIPNTIKNQPIAIPIPDFNLLTTKTRDLDLKKLMCYFIVYTFY